MIAGLVAPGWPAATSQLCSFSLSVFLVRLLPGFLTLSVREELLLGGFIFGFLGYVVPGLLPMNGPNQELLFKILFSCCGGLGAGLVSSAVGRINVNCLTGRNWSTWVKANFIIFPLLFFGIGGFSASRIFAIASSWRGFAAQDYLLVQGSLICFSVLFAAFVLVPRGYTIALVSKAPPPLMTPPNEDLIYFLLVGAFTVYYNSRPTFQAKVGPHALIANGLGRYFSGMASEIFGFNRSKAFAAIIASTVLLTALVTKTADLEERTAILLAASVGMGIGLIPRSRFSQTAAIIYGFSFFLNAVQGLPRLLQVFAHDAIGHILALLLLGTSILSYQSRTPNKST